MTSTSSSSTFSDRTIKVGTSLGSRVCTPPPFLIRPRTMHNKRALDRRLCRERAAARLLSQQWRGLHSAAVLETPGKQGNNAPYASCTSTGFRAFGGAHTLTNYHPPSLTPRPVSRVSSIFSRFRSIVSFEITRRACFSMKIFRALYRSGENRHISKLIRIFFVTNAGYILYNAGYKLSNVIKNFINIYTKMCATQQFYIMITFKDKFLKTNIFIYKNLSQALVENIIRFKYKACGRE